MLWTIPTQDATKIGIEKIVEESIPHEEPPMIGNPHAVENVGVEVGENVGMGNQRRGCDSPMSHKIGKIIQSSIT